MTSTITVSIVNNVGSIMLNRPDQLNALSALMREELAEALRSLDSNPTVRVILLHGAGNRAFCAGADIKEIESVESVVASRATRKSSAWRGCFLAVSKPVVAAIHGFCLGGGLEVALGCDIRIASPEAKFGLPEVNIGQIPGGGGTQNLSRAVGLARALDLILTGESIDAQKALEWGIVTRLSESRDSLHNEATAIAEQLAAKPPVAMLFAKEATRAGFEMELSRGLSQESDLFSLLMTTSDRVEAAAAFREKRRPIFSGG